jgi:hypothetical protein
MSKLRMVVFVFVLAAGGGISISTAPARQTDLPNSTLKTGDTIPELRGTDQFGKPQDFNSLKGANGLVLLFFRSADW